MPQGLQALRFSNDVVVPVYHPESTLELHVNLGPSTSFARGQLLKQSGSATNDVQTVTIGGSPTGGSFPLTATNPLTGVTATVTVNWNSTVAQTQALISPLFTPGTVTVTGATFPGAQVFTFSGGLAAMPIPAMTVATTGLTGGSPTAANVHTTTGVQANTYIVYPGSSGATTAILPFACQTDAAGNITISSVSGQAGGQWGDTFPSVPAYFSGYFDTLPLTGYDSNATTQLGKEIANLASGGKLLCVTGA